MDQPSGVRHLGGQRKPRNKMKTGPANPQLFDDTSTQPGPGNYPPPHTGFDPSVSPPPNLGAQYGYYPVEDSADYQEAYGQQAPYAGQSPQGPQFPGQQYLNDPMANMAMQYGTNLADQGKEIVQQKLEKYVSTSKLKYYFAVDTSYVGKKLGLLLFPFLHKDWSIKYNQDEPVAPRYEVNAPDMYIPVMAFVTYILLAGVVLGTQNMFTPEQLGMTASSALVWMVIEILVLLLVMYMLNVTTDLKYLDLLAYCGYKYVGMIISLLGSLLFESLGYYISLLWCSISISFFLVRSLKFAIIPHQDSDNFTRGSKRRLYTLLVIALSQPIFMWWLTSHIAFPKKKEVFNGM